MSVIPVLTLSCLLLICTGTFTMNWFKHFVNSTSDPDLMESETKFKTAGPYVFWRTLEILSRENALKEPLVMDFSTFKMWFPSISKPKLKEILIFFTKKRTNFDKIPRITCSWFEKSISIHCEKLSSISSDYIKKIQSKNGQCPKKSDPIEEEIRRRNKKKEKDSINNKDFNEFWEKYHSVTGLPKTDKEQSIKKYKRLTKTEREKALNSIEQYYNSLKNNNCIYKARTFLGDKCFNNEFKKQEVDGEW